MHPMKLILGTMTFGPQVDLAESRAMMQRFLEAGYREVDTAYVYNEGETERILGEILAGEQGGAYHLATKVNPRVTGSLDAKSITRQAHESLRRMGKQQVDILYLHMPDANTPIEQTLQACADLHREGVFLELGLSNFPAWMVVDIWHICRERGWPQPTVYQGLYNGLSRKCETELFPALRRLGMRFYAFNPLAGGMLTGKHTAFEQQPQGGRFALRQSYRKRYWKESFFEAVSHLTETCREHGITPVQAAFRWLAYHSLLDARAGDGIILGASRIEQLEQNLEAVQQGALPQEIAAAFETAWNEAAPDSPNYFYFYGA